uniref:hypothetical protein n=1 Tax=Paenibacillus sinopodophylli TaxID=1837342 RepID=UPI001BB1A95B
KKGKEGSMTPFDFLRVVVEEGDLMYTKQYQEYVDAMHGKRQLYWSRGLKDRYQIDDKTDEQLATEKEEPADRLGGIDWQDWRSLLHPKDRRVELLELIEKFGYEAALLKMGIKKESAAVTANSQSDEA